MASRHFCCGGDQAGRLNHNSTACEVTAGDRDFGHIHNREQRLRRGSWVGEP